MGISNRLRRGGHVVTSVKLVWNRGVTEQSMDTVAPVEKPMQLA
jgi:hypothetical protein